MKSNHLLKTFLVWGIVSLFFLSTAPTKAAGNCSTDTKPCSVDSDCSSGTESDCAHEYCDVPGTFTCKFIPPPPTGSSCSTDAKPCSGVGDTSCSSGTGNCSYEFCDPSKFVCTNIPFTPTPGVKTGGAGITCGTDGIETALGCISTNPATFVSTILKWVLGFAGGVALLLMVLGSFQMITSSGNPDALKSGQEQFTSAVIGLIFILLSVTLLEIIGVDILQIPGLTH